MVWVGFGFSVGLSLFCIPSASDISRQLPLPCFLCFFKLAEPFGKKVQISLFLGVEERWGRGGFFSGFGECDYESLIDGEARGWGAQGLGGSTVLSA